ncbi:MAG: hypothetical protein P4K93_09345 [Terracidiphilus sp.]|nr:hypothetical protein [Terracidiphilus sp.]MDR3798345.1 hypothetical protein [Terracidiphilus sp.]
MIAEPQSDCAVCRYWRDRIDTSRVRALQKAEGAHGDERQARRELAEHRERSHGGLHLAENFAWLGDSSITPTTARRI